MHLCDAVNELVLSVPLETKHNAKRTDKNLASFKFGPKNWMKGTLSHGNFNQMKENQQQ